MLIKTIDFLRNLQAFLTWTSAKLRILQKFLKRIFDLVNNSIGSGIDTTFTPFKVVYWFGYRKFQFLWSTPGIIGSSAITLFFTGIFLAKDYYSRKRRKQFYSYSFVAKTLAKCFSNELERDTWHRQTFKQWCTFEHWYHSCPESSQHLFRQILQVPTNQEVLIQIKQKFATCSSFTLKDILKWLPQYLQHTIGETATTQFTQDLLASEIAPKNNTSIVFSLPLIGVVISFLYYLKKAIHTRFLVASLSREQSLILAGDTQPQNYRLELAKAKTKRQNINYFEHQFSNLLMLKILLQQHQIGYELPQQPHLHGINQFNFQLTPKEVSDANLDIQQRAASFVPLKKAVTAKKIMANRLHKNTWLSSQNAKVFATSIGVGVSYFVSSSFIVWLGSELLRKVGIYLTVWNFSLFTGTWFNIIGIGLSITLGIALGIHAAHKAYKDHQAIKEKLKQAANLRVVDPLLDRSMPLIKLIANKQNELNQLKHELFAAKQLETQAIKAYNEKICQQKLEQKFLLKQQDWQTNIPDFINKFDAINYARFNETLSFKTSVKTYIKKTLNRGLALLMGGSTGSLIPRIIFSILKVLAPSVSLYALFTINPPLAVILTTLIAGSIIFFGAIYLWNYHLDRVKKDQQTFLDMLTPSTTSQPAPLQERLNRQIQLCQQLKQHVAEKIAAIKTANTKLDNIHKTDYVKDSLPMPKLIANKCFNNLNTLSIFSVNNKHKLASMESSSSNQPSSEPRIEADNPTRIHSLR